MSKTTLQFYRKSQCLTDLKKERPKSMDTVRDALQEATNDIEIRVNDLERLFYGGQHCEENIREIVPHCRNIMQTFAVTYIHAAWQLDDIIDRLRDPSETFKVDMTAVGEVKDYHRKLKDFLPKKFSELMEDVRTVVQYIKKYLLTFYHGGSDAAYLETCHHYDKRRKEYEDAITMHLNNITNMDTAYRENGLGVKHFGLRVNEIARACDCGDLPFLLAFPQACQNMRNCCAGILKWLEADEQYTDFLQHDISNLEIQKEKQSARLKNARETSWTLEHRLQNTHKEVGDLKGDLTRLAHREKQLNATVEELGKQIRFMEIDIELKEHERDLLTKKSASGEGREYIDEDTINSRLQEIAKIISSLRYEIPATRKNIENVKNKMALITDKRKLLSEKKVHMKSIREELNSSRAQLVFAENEMKRIDGALATMKDIMVRKTTHDLPKKIFHHMPVKIRNARESIRRGGPQPPAVPKIRDNLDRAFLIVARNIEHDWQRLYRNLPFYPPRGKSNLDDDLDAIIKENYRTNDFTMSRESLLLWRRQHTRASLVELKETLRTLKLDHVIEKLTEAQMRPKKPTERPGKRRWKRFKQVGTAVARMTSLRRKQIVANRAFLAEYTAARAAAAAAADAQKLEDDLVLPQIVVSPSNG